MFQLPWLLLLITALGVGGCVRPEARSGAEPGDSLSSEDHGSDPELRRILDQTDVLLLGETHGTREVPAYVLSVLQVLLTDGEPVVLGLEVPEDEQPALDAYLRSQGTPVDRKELLRGHFWRLLAVDGRGSQALLELIDTLRQRIASGDPVDVVCLDESMDGESAISRDEHMAKRLLELRAQRPEAKYVVLVGGYHAMTEHGEDLQIRPMGSYVAREVPGVVALWMRHAGGTSWTWPVSGEPGIHAQEGTGAPDAYGVQLFEEPDSRGFSGVFDLGRITASPPANERAGEPVRD